MNYDGIDFEGFSIMTELKGGIKDYWETTKIREYVQDILRDGIEKIKNKYNIDFQWYVEIEDRTDVYLEVKECDDSKAIKYLLDLVADKFTTSDVLIYINDSVGDIGCISNLDEGFDYKLLG